MKNKKKLFLQLNNSGAALVSVIVIVAFISVIATIMLYMSAMNFYMKTTDMRIKESFYDGEKALEEIRAALIVDATKAFDKAYQNIAVEYINLTPAERQSHFYDAFVDAFESEWNTQKAAATNTRMANHFKNKVDGKYQAGIVTEPVGDPDSYFILEKNASQGYVVVRNVSYKYTVNKYTTMITTDYVIKAPKLDFTVTQSNDTLPNPAPVGIDKPNEISMVNCVTYNNWTKR